MGRETTISSWAVKVHEGVRAFKQERSMENAQHLVKAYYWLLANEGGEAVTFELSTRELELVNRAAEMAYRGQGRVVTA